MFLFYSSHFGVFFLYFYIFKIHLKLNRCYSSLNIQTKLIFILLGIISSFFHNFFEKLFGQPQNENKKTKSPKKTESPPAKYVLFILSFIQFLISNRVKKKTKFKMKRFIKQMEIKISFYSKFDFSFSFLFLFISLWNPLIADFSSIAHIE